MLALREALRARACPLAPPCRTTVKQSTVNGHEQGAREKKEGVWEDTRMLSVEIATGTASVGPEMVSSDPPRGGLSPFGHLQAVIGKSGVWEDTRMLGDGRVRLPQGRARWKGQGSSFQELVSDRSQVAWLPSGTRSKALGWCVTDWGHRELCVLESTCIWISHSIQSNNIKRTTAFQ